MIYLPVTLLLFLLFLLLFPFIWFAIALDVVEVAVAKLGFSPNVALLLFATVVLGSTIIAITQRQRLRTLDKICIRSYHSTIWLNQMLLLTEFLVLSLT